jgi:hypothetical protein
MHKPKNPFDEQRERDEKARRKANAIRREQMVKERTGITRQSHTIHVQGCVLRQLTDVEHLHSRWLKNRNGKTIVAELLRYTFEDTTGLCHTVKQMQIHYADGGYLLRISRFYDLHVVDCPAIVK